MQKQSQQRNVRQTPPFVQFQSVRQCLRISLPHEHLQAISGLKSMEQINKHIQQLASNNQTKDNNKTRHKRSSTCDVFEVLNTLNNKSNKGHKNRNNSMQTKMPDYDYRLDSQFTAKHEQQDCHKTKTKKQRKRNKSDQHKKKRKAKSSEKYKGVVQNRPKKIDLSKMLSFTQCVYPNSLDLKDVYKIHSMRPIQTQSHLSQKKGTKRIRHSRGMSEGFNIINKGKTEQYNKKLKQLDKSTKILKEKTGSEQIDIAKNICLSNSLASIDYFRMITQEMQNQKQKNSKKAKQLINSLYKECEEQIDSEDEQLLTMISVDTQQMRIKIQNKYTYSQSSNPNNHHNTQKLSIKNQQIDIDSVNKSQNKNKKQCKNTIVQTKQKQQLVGRVGHEKNKLITTIDQVLFQITNFQKNEQALEKKIIDQPSQDENLLESESKQSKVASKSSNSQLTNFRQTKWKDQPAIWQLELILQNCLNQTLTNKNKKPRNGDLQDARVVRTQNYLQSIKNEKQLLQDNSIEQKLKLSRIKEIQKAKKALKLGLLQADKLLSIPLDKEELASSHRTLLKGLTKSTYKSKSLDDLRYKRSEDLEQKAQNKQDQRKIKYDQQNQSEKSIIDDVIDTHLYHQEKSGKKQISNNLNQSYSDQQQNILKQQKRTIELDKQQQQKKRKVSKQYSRNEKQRIYDSNKNSFLGEEVESNNNVYKIQMLSMYKSEQMEQIVQFMFIDLCLEVIQEIQIYFQHSTETFQHLYDKFPIHKVSKKLGFNTGYKDVYQVLQKFSKFIQNNVDKQQNVSYKQLIRRRVSEPIGPKPMQLLKFMRQTNENFQQQDEQESFEGKSSFAFSISWFQQFSLLYVNQYEFGTYYEFDKDKENKRLAFLKNAMHIHNKAIFDSLNETIDRHRPFGLIGQPFPWKAAIAPAPMSKEQFHKIINNTFEQVIESSKYLCGIFVEQHTSHKLSKFEYQQLVQDRLHKLLKQDIDQNISRWAFFDDEQTEVLIQVSNFITKALIIQACKQVKEISVQTNER